MKEENYLEGIYGCLERIEKKVEILSSAPVDKNNAVTGDETGIAMLREIRDGLERDLNGIRKSANMPERSSPSAKACRTCPAGIRCRTGPLKSWPG